MRVISQKLRDSARGRECTLRIEGVCNYNPETTVLAHLPVRQGGFGMKNPDIFGIFCCSACHDRIDQRSKGLVDWKDVLRALAETQMYWVEQGLIVIKGMK